MARRTPFLPAAVLGNGELLVALSARGEVERLFWPRVDGPAQVRELRLAVSLGNGPGRALDEEPFVWEQGYERDATVLRAVASDGELSVELLDLIDVDEPVLIRRVRAEPADGSLLVSVTPSLGGSETLNGGYVDPATGAFVGYARGAALAMLTDPPPAGAAVRRLATGERAAVEHRFPISGELTVPLGGETTVYLSLGVTAADAIERATAARDAGFAPLRERRVRRDHELVLAVRPELRLVTDLASDMAGRATSRR